MSQHDPGDETDEESVSEILERAGWYPGREETDQAHAWSVVLDKPGGFQMFPAARKALSEYGGLRLYASGPGKHCARGSMVLDPALASGEEDRFARFEEFAGGRLYPLGEADEGHAFLAIDERGRVFSSWTTVN